MEFSGNIRLRLPSDLHEALASLADECGISLNTFMVTLLAEGVARRSGSRLGPPRDLVAALTEAVLDSVHQPTRRGQLVARLDARHPEWRMWIPAERLADCATPSVPTAEVAQRAMREKSSGIRAAHVSWPFRSPPPTAVRGANRGPMNNVLHTAVLTLGVGLLYLLLVRFLDLNEKEPLWAIAMLFVLGALAAIVLPRIVSSPVLALTVFPSAAAKEGARFGAIAAGVGVLTLLGQKRGWSEIDGVMDGLVYGACGGFGFATGEVLVRDLTFGGGVPGLESTVLPSLGSAAFAGLADGVFGALIGAGLAAALHARSTVARVLLSIGGFAAAVIAHAGHTELSQGNSLSGTQGLIRAWIGLILPLALVVAMGVIALGAEKRAIREELAAEAEGGVVTADDFALLTNLFKRQGVYLKALVTAKIGALMRMRALHNRQVQLALAKKRAVSRAEAREEVARLRVAVLELKKGAS